jgi:hypothetical protein
MFAIMKRTILRLAYSGTLGAIKTAEKQGYLTSGSFKALLEDASEGNTGTLLRIITQLNRMDHGAKEKKKT